MNNKIEEYIQKIEKELEELGIKVTFKEDGSSSASGTGNVLISAKVERAKVLTAKLEGFKDALRLLEKE